MPKFYARILMNKIEIEADSVELELDDGTTFELSFLKSDETVSLDTNGRLVVYPRAANLVYLKGER